MPNEEEPMGEEQGPEEDSNDVAEASGESQDARSGKVPVKPSFAEIERHRIAHYPYRCWCPECVMGQATGSGHLTKEYESKIPIVGMDYFFINDKGRLLGRSELGDPVQRDEEVKKGTLIKCLVVRDRHTRAIFAFTVPQKGVDDERWVVKQVVQIVEWLGHSRVILKSDNERSLLTLVRQALKDLRVQDVSGSPENRRTMTVRPTAARRRRYE